MPRKIKKPKNKLVDVHFILHSDDEHQRALFQYMQRTRRHRSFTQHLHEMVHFAAAQMSANDHEEKING